MTQTTSNSGFLPVTNQDIGVTLTLPDTSSAASETATGIVSTSTIGLPANVAIVIDVSGSTGGTASTTNPIPDANNNGFPGQIIDAEIVGVEALVNSIIDDGFSDTNISLISFASGSTQVFEGTASDDADSNGVPDIIDAARTLQSGGGTSFPAALDETIDYFTTGSVNPDGGNILFFLSDGFNNGGDFSAQVATLTDPNGINATINAIGVGAGASEAQLDLLDDGIDNDTAQIVLDPSLLDAALTGSAALQADILGVELFVNGNLEVTVDGGSLTNTALGLQYTSPVPLDTTIDDLVRANVLVDQDGDGTVDFTIDVDQVVEQNGTTPPPPPPPPPSPCTEIEFTKPSETESFTGGQVVAKGFDINEVGAGESTFDTFDINVAGFNTSISSNEDFLAFITTIETDGVGTTDAVYNADGDLTLVFSRNADGSVNDALVFESFTDDDSVELQDLIDAGADLANSNPDESDAVCGFNPGGPVVPVCTEIEFTKPSETESYTGGQVVAKGFDVNEVGAGESTFDTFNIDFGAFNTSISSNEEFIAFITTIETDGDGSNDAVYNTDGDLTLVFSRNADGSVNDALVFEGIIDGDSLTLQEVVDAGADLANSNADESDMVCGFNMPDPVPFA